MKYLIVIERTSTGYSAYLPTFLDASRRLEPRMRFSGR